MTDPTRKVRMPGTLPIGWKAVLIVLPLVTALVALSIGRYAIPIRDVAGSIFGHLRGVEVLSSKDALVLWNIRMPRILLALLAGAGLSLSGLAFQSLFANPLATPDTLGVASG
ncbi:MAG: iron ABC transporter permease, partial [Clostridiales bacterium]|nr:iron ABC transporter permease [Clostridiales bacterium]